MKKYFFYFFLCFIVAGKAQERNLDKYKYVKVPQKFEFLKENNQYQLNALSAFLFEKAGFEVLYNGQVPAGIDACNVLQADVHSDSGLFRTRLYITLENCKNEIVFKSKTGVSREKEYKVSYQEALREAFSSIEELNHSYALAENSASGRNANVEPKQSEIIIDPVVPAKEIDKVAVSEEPVKVKTVALEIGDIRKFTNGTSVYVLRKTSGGFDLFREGEGEKVARLLRSAGGDSYLYSSNKISGSAFFDHEGNLVVEYLDQDSGQLISIHYHLQAQ